MLRATDFRRVGFRGNDIKLLLIDACLDCECDRITIVYAVEDVDKIIMRMSLGDVILWVLTKDWTFQFFDRILDEDSMQLLQDTDELQGIRKMYRIELMASGYNVVELKLDE